LTFSLLAESDLPPEVAFEIPGHITLANKRGFLIFESANKVLQGRKNAENFKALDLDFALCLQN